MVCFELAIPVLRAGSALRTIRGCWNFLIGLAIDSISLNPDSLLAAVRRMAVAEADLGHPQRRSRMRPRFLSSHAAIARTGRMRRVSSRSVDLDQEPPHRIHYTSFKVVVRLTVT